MALKIGANSINKLYLDSTPINKAYLGAGILFSGFSPTDLFTGGDKGWLADLTTVYSDTAGTTLTTELGGDVRRVNDMIESGLNATSATAWLLRRDAFYSLERAGGTFSVTLPDLGTAATVAYVDETTGVTILTAQTISGSFSLPTSARLGPVVIIDRALTVPETTAITAWLNERRPGNWLLGLGVWDDAAEWDDTAVWQSAA